MGRDNGDTKTFLILGGYGKAGLATAKLLLKSTQETSVVLAGRDAEKAASAASALNLEFGGDRCSYRRADAADWDSLDVAFNDIDMVVVASSTAQYVDNVAEAAIRHHIDYFDMHFSSKKYETLRAKEKNIKEVGCCFITDGGFHPGVPSALVRYAANHFDRMREACVGSVIAENWKEYDVGLETKLEFIREFRSFKTLQFVHGQWEEMQMHKPIAMDFGREFGTRKCIAMDLEEMHDLPKLYPDLQKTAFYVGGFNWFVDLVLTPFIILILCICPECCDRAMAKLFFWACGIFAKPPYGTLLKAEAKGTNGGRDCAFNVTLYHKDGYFFTAAPVVACLLQYLDSKKPGLWFQANVVEPQRFLKDLETMGIEVKTDSWFL